MGKKLNWLACSWQEGQDVREAGLEQHSGELILAPIAQVHALPIPLTPSLCAFGKLTYLLSASISFV